MDDLSASLRSRFPYLPLGNFPTRVERVSGLAPPDVELWVKHENESSELFGGNKVRKLEFMLGAARACGMRHVSTFGGTGAHHVAATALHGAAHGFDVEAFVFPQPIDDHVRALLAVERAAGASVHEVASMLQVIPHRVYPRGAWLAGGGSSAVGTLGWVSGGGEILSQLPEIDVVYCALGSCGTVAGLWWSLRRARPIEIVAVRVAGRPVGKLLARRLLRGVSRLLDPLDIAPRGEMPAVRVVHDFLGPGYGWPSIESRAAVTRASEVGLELDPIYTGKVMAALLHDARAGKLANKRVLFMRTQSTAPLDARVILTSLRRREASGHVDCSTPIRAAGRA
ncbi:MAG TPA: pyridoxal-phosphate dependent enzyme [Polyangiaceae bacterium]|jgi:D-cysteine desulfhydrase|nr:pyridoxal-phosphate dependent enzyme [Polyangiaceae bacterium]